MRHFLSIIILLLIYSCKEANNTNLTTAANESTATTVTTTNDKKPVDIQSLPLTADQENYRLIKVVDNVTNAWGMDWLPDGTLIYTEKSGELFSFKNDSKTEITNVPEVYVRGQGGLLDVIVHPQFASNNWIYLSYASSIDANKGGNTTIARATLKNHTLSEVTVLYKATPDSRRGQHFGSRFTWDKEEHLYFSIGDRFNRDENPQDVDRDGGKIYRINDDGSIPNSNPFKDDNGKPTAVYSYGHRNPQGLLTHPITGDVIAHEHGPKGGDEINSIQSGVNYGWPLASYGINYDGSKLTKNKSLPQMQSPLAYWTPSIAPSGYAIVAGDNYPQWTNNHLVGSLKFQYLEMLIVKDDKITGREKIADGLGRMRNVKMSPDGFIYLSVENKGIYRIEI